MRNVKGVLFADYVRMLRSRKDLDRSGLTVEDLAFLDTRIEPSAWYPMESFERLGNAILRGLANSSLEAVHMWGRFSVDQLRAQHPSLVVHGDPVETMARFRVLRSSFFNFEAVEVPMLSDVEAHVIVRYHMGRIAEEAAAHQTLGFFERLLEVAGAEQIRARIVEKSWDGGSRTLIALSFRMPH